MAKITRNSYHCTPTSKINTTDITTDLTGKITTYLKPNNYDRWAQLYWKRELEEGLSATEEEELAALERENMKTIEGVYQRLKSNSEGSGAHREDKGV